MKTSKLIAVGALGLAFVNPAAGLTLEEADRLTLERSPEIAALRAAVASADGAVRQAGAIPNPVLALEAEDFGFDRPGWDDSQLTLTFEQPVELGGKRAARRDERRSARDVAAAELDIRIRDLRAEVRRSFAAGLHAQERVRILHETLETVAEISAAVGELVRAGEVSPVEKLRAENEAALARADHEVGHGELLVATRRLVALWGGVAADAETLDGQLPHDSAAAEHDDVLLPPDDLPDLAAREAEIRRLESAVQREKRNRIPDATLTLGMRRFPGMDEHTFIAGVGLPLPLFDRNRGAIEEATADLERARHERDALAIRLARDLDSARQKLRSVQSETKLLHDDILPRSREILAAMEEGYRRGKFRLLDLLDARRTTLAAELRCNDAHFGLELARIEVQRLAGAAAPATEDR